MWSSKHRSGDCLEFPWGGCQGNHNNFLTLTQCRWAKGQNNHITTQKRWTIYCHKFGNNSNIFPFFQWRVSLIAINNKRIDNLNNPLVREVKWSSLWVIHILTIWSKQGSLPSGRERGTNYKHHPKTQGTQILLIPGLKLPQVPKVSTNCTLWSLRFRGCMFVRGNKEVENYLDV